MSKSLNAHLQPAPGTPYHSLLYISPQGLSNLRTYRYSATLSSPLDTFVMTPFWNYCVTFLPLWAAPNLITVISLFCAFCAYLLLTLYTPNLVGSPPPWAFFTAAFFMFAYQTLDAIDGKQARRTQSFSPLGQLFDHGCDAVCAVFHGLFLASSTSSGSTFMSLALLYIPIVPFFLSNWEEATTGHMRFGWMGVTEAQFASIGVLVGTGLYGGTKLWDVHLLGWFTMRHLFMFVGVLGLIYHFSASFLVVYKYINEAKPSAYTVQQSINQIVQYFAFISISALLILSPYSRVFVEFPRLLLWLVGLLASYQVSRLIICHVSLDACPKLWPIMWPFPIITLNAWFHFLPFGEYFWLYLYLICIVLMYAHFVYVSIQQITSFLGIKVFTIPLMNRTVSANGVKR